MCSRTSIRFHHDRAGVAPVLTELGAIAPLIETTGFQLRFVP
jgi:hypothetical protein